MVDFPDFLKTEGQPFAAGIGAGKRSEPAAKPLYFKKLRLLLIGLKFDLIVSGV